MIVRCSRAACQLVLNDAAAWHRHEGSPLVGGDPYCQACALAINRESGGRNPVLPPKPVTPPKPELPLDEQRRRWRALRDRWRAKRPNSGYVSAGPKMHPDRYEEVPESEIPEGTRWRYLEMGDHAKTWRSTYAIGRIYRRIQWHNGETRYYRLKDLPAPTPAEKIDHEPETVKHSHTYTVGQQCWFIDQAAVWFRVEVVPSEPGRIAIRPVTSYDSSRLVPWELGEVLEFPRASPLYKRLRPLSARQP